MFDKRYLAEVFRRAALPVDIEDITEVTEPPGGTYNYVCMIRTRKGNYIWKEAREKLKSDVFGSLDLDPKKRMEAEYRASTVYSGILGESVIPKIFCYDRTKPGILMHAFDGHLLKEELLEGVMDIRHLRQIGTNLGKIHAGTRGRYHDAKEFENEQARECELRTHYFGMCTASDSGTAKMLEALALSHRKSRECIIHADLTSRSVIVDNGTTHIIDFELAHLGSPEYDIGHILPEYFLADIGSAAPRSDPLGIFHIFFDSYFAEHCPEDRMGFMATACNHTGAIMLYRIDGMAKTDFLRTESQEKRARELARYFLAASSSL